MAVKLTEQGWGWIFILEGLATVLLGIASYWVIQDFPDTAKFLTAEESTKAPQVDQIIHLTPVS